MHRRTAPGSRQAPSLPHVVRTVIEIAAPPTRVFEALTDPDAMAAWWNDGDAVIVGAHSESWPGGAWSVRLVDHRGVERIIGGEYRLIDEPRVLEQTWRADDERADSVVRYELESIELDGAEGTRLTVTHSLPAGSAIRAHAQAWMGALAALAIHVCQPSLSLLPA